MKNINIKLEDRIYFDLVALKAQYKAATWSKLFEALILVSKGMKVG